MKNSFLPSENYNVGYIDKGNTHIIADMIADATGADIFEIVPEKGYPKDDYNECIEIAKNELQSDFTLSDEDMAEIAKLDTGKSLFFDHHDPEVVKMFMGLR